MQQIMRCLSPVFGIEVEHPPHGLRVLLLPAPGEQHTFGLSMVAEFFRRAGWEVAGGALETDADPVSIIQDSWFDIVGISVGVEAQVNSLTTGIAALRRASLNQQIGVMVGGPIFREYPELVARVGADATAVDGRQRGEISWYGFARDRVNWSPRACEMRCPIAGRLMRHLASFWSAMNHADCPRVTKTPATCA